MPHPRVTLRQAAKATRMQGAAMWLWAVLLASALALCCEEKSLIISAGDAVVDPRIAPRVLSTFPPINSVGPYSEWESAGWFLPQARMEIRFNKVMDFTSVVRGIRVASSHRELRIDSLSLININREAFSFTATGMDVLDVHVGEVLTLSLAPRVSDVNGNTIAPGVIGSFIPEPLFRIRRSSPPAGTTLSAGAEQYFTLHFNSTIDSSILPYVDFTPSVSTQKVLSSDSTIVYLFATLAEPVQRYLLRVASGAPDTHGHLLVNAYAAQFLGVPFELAVRLSATTDVPLYTSYSLSSGQLLDTSTFRSAFHITPEVAGGMTFAYSKEKMKIRPSVEYAPETNYAIRVDTTLRSVEGYRLSKEFTLSFRTGVFGVTSSAPVDQARDVSRTGGAVVYFSARLDSSTIRRSITADPEIRGLFFSKAPAFVQVASADSLLPNQTYVVTIDTSIRSVSGYTLASPYTFSFTTGAE